MLKNKTVFDINWLSELDALALQQVLQEYRYLVHRFTIWLGLIISNSEEEEIKELLMPNFMEESGKNDLAVAHIDMLDIFLQSCGINDPDKYIPLQSTVEIESFFFGIFSKKNTYQGLCAIGPATEEISGQFLNPMLLAIKKVFHDKLIDFTYFDNHLSEMELEHVKSIQEAILFLENKKPYLKNRKDKLINESMQKHILFWDTLKMTFHKTTKVAKPAD